MTRRCWMWMTLLLLTGLLAIWLWKLSPRMTPQVVLLPNGIAYQYVGATYGTNHIMGSTLARIVRKLPQFLQGWAGPLLGSRLTQLNSQTTSQPSLCVWFKPLGTNWVGTTLPSSIRMMVADENGVAAGEREYVSLWFGASGPQWLHPDFIAIPRRSAVLECCLVEEQKQEENGEYPRIRFPNPCYGHYPQWEPEQLPTVKMAGDLLVRLKSFSTGHGNASQTVPQKNGPPITRFRPARPGEPQRAVFQLEFESPRGTNETWTMNTASLSDATGNHLPATSRRESGTGQFAISPVLWANEAAWRLTVELERKAGFAPEELVIFRDVPVPAMGETNAPALTNRVGDFQFAMAEFVRRPDLTGGSWSSSDASSIRIEHTPIPDGYSFDFVESQAEDGSALEVVSRGWSHTYYEIYFKALPTNTTTVTVTYAFQKTRTVEFLVKPEIVGPEEEEAN